MRFQNSAISKDLIIAQQSDRPFWLTATLGLFFFVSGFTGLLYQLVWLRLAFASFGIVTGVLSVVVAVFMLGLAVGSWLGGLVIAPLTQRTQMPAILFYGATEFLTGIGAFVVPQVFGYGERLLTGLGETNSIIYLSLSALVLALSLFPWCFSMGATFPFMMAFMKGIDSSETSAFSFLYACNVLGAMIGTLVTAFVLIELLGFHSTLRLGGTMNFSVAAFSMVIAYFVGKPAVPIRVNESPAANSSHERASINNLILFITGFTSLGMEVVWTRAFTPVLGTEVYAFALLLFVYLLATRIGSVVYRKHLGCTRSYSTPHLMALLSIAAFLPIVLNDPQIMNQTLRLPKLILLLAIVLSIAPYCAFLGYLTPYLIDSSAAGNPAEAGRAYAINILGCVLGPLLASYVLLPQLGAKNAMVTMAIPFVIFFGFYFPSLRERSRWVAALITITFLVSSIFFHLSYEDPVGRNSKFYVVRRDYAATVTSVGQGMEKRLYVNGVGITNLTPITKFMAHLPLGFLSEKPKSALVICFGMGTTYRSLMSWGIHVTGVELVPSVKGAFSYYFDDAKPLLASGMGQVVIDDGRRFLNRTQKKFDVITIDPPPPIEAVGSSLLYSTQFYELVKRHLKPTSILQQWFPGGDLEILQAVGRSLKNEFPYLKVYRSIEGRGYHFLASMSLLRTPSAEEIAKRMPKSARVDLMEWDGKQDLRKYLQQVLAREIPVDELLNKNVNIRITDDHPFNEYFLLRRLGLPVVSR